MDPIVTSEIPVAVAQREPTDAELLAAKDALAQLAAEAQALGNSAAAAPVHYGMGRIFVEQLGDERSAALCYQNAFALNPAYRPNLEAARRLFKSAGQHEKALALHRHEAALLREPAPRAESLRAQALVLRELRRDEEAKQLIGEALQLDPEHPALLTASIEAALREGDRLLCARLLLRFAGVTRDPVHKAQLLRRAVLLVEELQGEPEPSSPLPSAPARATAAELSALHEEALRKLFQADAHDGVGFLGMLLRARSSNDWEAVLRLCRQRAERTGSASERWLVASIAAVRLGRVSEGLAEVAAALEANRRDGALLALRTELAEQQKSPDLPELLRQRAEGCVEATERGHLKFRAAMLLEDPLEREQLLSDALAENPGDAAAIALHARLVALRDAASAGERFVALGEALEAHSPEEAAAHYLEAGAWQERSGSRVEAAALARRVLKLSPRHPAALRLLARTLPALGAQGELADLLEETSTHLPRALGAEFLARAAALVTESQPERALVLAQRAAEMARGLSSPRWLETWATLAFKAGDLPRLSEALEARADSTLGADAADLLLEASELSRAAGDDARSTTLLRKARGVDAQSSAARNALLALPGLPAEDRIDLLAEEARQAMPERAAALYSERAVVLELEGRLDEAAEACAESLALAGVDLAVLRRLAQLHLRRGDHAAALAALVQVAEAVPEGNARAEAYGRAAELSEWRVGDARKAVELYRLAAQAHPQAAFAWAQLARLLAWTGSHVEAADAYAQLASVAQHSGERNEARRWAASLYAHRAGQPGKATALLRALVEDAPGDLEAMAELLALIAHDQGTEVRRERADLRARLASRCQDPRVAAVLRAESAEDRLAAGERDQGIAEYRRALALNPQDRVALDLVEEALRLSGQKALLAEHLAFRCAFADPQTRAALALQQAEIFTEQGRMEEAGAAFRQALASDPDSLLAVKGARHIAGLQGDRQEVMRLLAREAALAPNPGLAAGVMVEAALLADDGGESGEAVQQRTAVLNSDPLDSGSADALELSADAAEASGRAQDLVDALQKRLALPAGEAEAAELKLRLGRAYAHLGDAAQALPLLGASAATLEPRLLLKLAEGVKALPQADAVRLYRWLLDVFPAPAESGPGKAQLLEWTLELARAQLASGQREEALEGFRRALALEGQDAAALHGLFGLFTSAGNSAGGFCAAAALVGLDAATPEERAQHEAVAARPPPVELPQLADSPAMHAAEVNGALYALLTAAGPDLARALPTDMSGGRGALVKGDNPVRRVVAAIARALGMAEPQLFLARHEPAVVAPVSGEGAALLVGAEVPKRFTPRQQRFLYARALAHIRRATHPLAPLSAQRLAALAGELIRLCVPQGKELEALPEPDAALADLLERHLPADARTRLAPLASRAAAELPADWDSLALGIRESAERAGLAVCADPAAAISIVSSEVEGGIARPEVSRLVRFSVSDAYLAIRPH